MCGIAGFFGHRDHAIAPAVVESMTAALVHRGPDDGGHFGVRGDGSGVLWKAGGVEPNALKVALGFRRLSILDLSPNGAQPMQSADGRYTLAFNGQIYNYVELKEELGDVTFRSSADTEVLLHYLIRHGMAALDRLDGMFAFAFHDLQTGELFLARDRFGIKPLYWFRDERGLFFASEIRALQKAHNGPLRIRKSLLARWFLNNWIAEPDTLFEGIYKLEPGHFLRLSPNGEVTGARYWDLRYQPDTSKGMDDWVEILRSALWQSVRRQMRSDVPVGFFLSGGLDSSLLAARATEFQDRPTTYTIGFRWGRYEGENLDLESARKFKDRFAVDYREIILEPSILSLLPKVVATLEEPINDAAAVCSYLICEAAAKEFKVLVSGQGGDELFGGYSVYPAGLVTGALAKLPPSAGAFVAGVTKRLPYGVFGRSVQAVHRARKIATAALDDWPQGFCRLRGAMTPDQATALLVSELGPLQEDPFAAQKRWHEEARDWDPLHQMLYLDAKTYLPALNLAYSDRTSMAHSVELRVPFLGNDVVDVVSHMPAQFKLRGTRGKVTLKALGTKILPPELVHRPKAGFGLPLREWFLSDLQPLARELLSEDRLRRQGILNPSLPTRWLDEHGARKADHCMKLYGLMTFQLWCEHYKF